MNHHYFDRPLIIWTMGEGIPPVTPELLAFLLENNYDPNVKDEQHSALGFCAYPGQSFLTYDHKFEMVKSLLKHGANPNVHYLGKPILHRFVDPIHKDNPHQLKIIELLLDAGADVNVVDKKGKTPLDIVLFYGGNDDTTIKIVGMLERFDAERSVEL